MTAGKNKWPVGLSVYLGNTEETARRRIALRAVAERLGIDTSKLIRKIADGELIICVPLEASQEHTAHVRNPIDTDL